MDSPSLLTVAERTGFRQTGRLQEVDTLCSQFATSWPKAVRSFEFGRSSAGHILRALIVSETGALTADSLHARKIPLLYLQGGIHPGESDGKDAGFIALREMLQGAAAPGLLDKIAILFVPAFNADGHERCGRWNRPNQNGPEETGWRTNAQNLNLNRDYTKADAPEMRAMLRLLTEWDPLVCADLHVTDGADFEPDISIQVEPLNQGDPDLRTAGQALRDELVGRLEKQGSLPLPFYPDFARTDDPASGFALTVFSPRFSTGYFPQRNRFTVLVETHSWKPYERRVRVTRNSIVSLVDMLAKQGRTWLEMAHRADANAARLAGTELPIEFATSWREPAKAGNATTERADTEQARMIDFRGYAYTRTPSEISGELVTTYDPRTPQIWRVPLRDQVKPTVIARVPRGGYVLPLPFVSDIAPRIEAHGIRFERWRKSEQSVIQTFRADKVSFSATPFEGRMRATLEGEWREEEMEIPPDSLFIPSAQPLARLVVALFEPLAPDSFAAWGFFNACFEQKEQLEAYVAEEIARGMLETNSALQAEFNARLQDPELAADAGARLEFFLRRHASWDARHNLYPVLRVEHAL